MNRREFIHDLSHLAALGGVLPTLGFGMFDSSYELLSETVSPGNILILIRLDGGNDGLNTVIPLDQYSVLNNVRPDVIMPENKLVDLGKNDLALHPSLSDFKAFSDEKRMKIIQNVGYEQPDFSHFRSMDIWQSASDYNEFVTSGWVGRYLEDRHPNFPNNYPNETYPHPLAIELGHQTSLMLTGQYTFPSFTANNPSHFIEIINEFDHNYPNTRSGDKLKYIQMIAKQSNLYSQVVKEAYESVGNTVAFPNTHLGWQFEIISRLIKGGLNTRVYVAQIGGFDTHDSQVDLSDATKGEHAYILKELNDSVTALIKSLDASGDSDRVLTMTFSEFGRTIVSNGSYGTDHGTAAPMFIFGNQLDPSVLGKNPDIPANAQWQDNLEVEFDFRQIYSSIISQWLGGESQTELNTLFKEFQKVPITGEYVDLDEDGVRDPIDECLGTPAGAMVDVRGCEVFSLPHDTFEVKVISATCPDSANGVIEISCSNSSYSYSYSLNGAASVALSTENNFYDRIENLSKGTYQIAIAVNGQNYERIYTVTVGEPDPLVASTRLQLDTQTVDLSLAGATSYTVQLNGRRFDTTQKNLTLNLSPGMNRLAVSTDLDCQGVYEEEIFVSEKVQVYPNPTNGPLSVYVSGKDAKVEVTARSIDGSLVFNQVHEVGWKRTFDMDISSLNPGIYVLSITGETTSVSHKIIKN
jgi:uncharacterized protein (DUF1501 family)